MNPYIKAKRVVAINPEGEARVLCILKFKRFVRKIAIMKGEKTRSNVTRSISEPRKIKRAYFGRTFSFQ